MPCRDKEGEGGESEAVESRLEMERCILGSRETSEKKGSQRGEKKQYRMSEDRSAH